MTYRLLDEFRGLFEGKKYIHRDSSRGDWVAHHLYEDLFTLGKSKLLVTRISSREHVLNVQNQRQGIQARRGDGTFGELVPGIVAIIDPGFSVARGPIANVELGVEVKILAKAMIKQIGRVKTDMKQQIGEFHRGAGTPICIGIVGINHAAHSVSYEGPERVWRTDGKTHKHPIQEAADAERRLLHDVAPKFDEFLFLRYRATNEAPFAFEWVDYIDTFKDYGAVLTRISRTYDTRFGS
jgi:hypothetical protein